MGNVAILINSCDSYEDLWEPFFILFEKYCKSDFKVYLNIEEKTPLIKNVEVINFPKNECWGKRFKNALNNIEEDYVIILLDDFFLRKEVNMSEILNCVNYLDENREISCFYFNDTGQRFISEFIDDDSYDKYLLAKQDAHYVYNLQAAIWRKDDLVEKVYDFESPWSWEVLGSKYENSKSKFYFLKSACSRVFDYGYNPSGMGVFRGKWVLEDVNPLFEKEGIRVDYSKRGIYRANNNVILLLIEKLKMRISLKKMEIKFYKGRN